MAVMPSLPQWSRILQQRVNDTLIRPSKQTNLNQNLGVSYSEEGEAYTEQYMAKIYKTKNDRKEMKSYQLVPGNQYSRNNRLGATPSVTTADIRTFFVPKSQRSSPRFAVLLRSITTERLRQIKAKQVLKNTHFEKLEVLSLRHNDSLCQIATEYRNSGGSFETKLRGEEVTPEDNVFLPSKNKSSGGYTGVSLQYSIFHGISYVDYRRVGFMMPVSAQYLFRPSIFLKFRRDQHGRCNARKFHEYINRKEGLIAERYGLCNCDTNGDGYLRESDLEYFFEDFIDRVSSLVDLQEDFRTYYVFTAVRKMFFFLDPWGRLKISIKDILTSAVFREVHDMTTLNPRQDERQIQQNWFSGISAMAVYRNYLELDIDQNGMLSKSELAGYDNCSLTACFVDRVWEECRTYLNDTSGEKEMDYKVFLDFTLAMENRNTLQGLRWFFKILDIGKNGYLDYFVLSFFFRHVIERLDDADYNTEDVLDEIFDMVKPQTNYKITLEDLVKCGVGGTVVSMLIDVNGFWAYDNRESLIASHSSNNDTVVQQQHHVSYNNIEGAI